MPVREQIQVTKNLFINQNSPFTNSANDINQPVVPNAWTSSNSKFTSPNVAPIQMRDSPLIPQPLSGSGYYTPNSSKSTLPYSTYLGQSNSNFSTPAHTGHPMQGSSHFSPTMQPDAGMFQKQNFRGYNVNLHNNSGLNRQGLSNISYSSSSINNSGNRNPFTGDSSIDPNSNISEFTQRSNYNNFAAAPFSTGPFNNHSGIDNHNSRYLAGGSKEISRSFNSQQDNSFNSSARSFNQFNSQIGGIGINKEFAFNTFDLTQTNAYSSNFNENSLNDSRLSANEPFHKNEAVSHNAGYPKYGVDTNTNTNDKKLSLFESELHSTNQLDFSVFPTRFNSSGQSINFV